VNDRLVSLLSVANQSNFVLREMIELSDSCLASLGAVVGANLKVRMTYWIRFDCFILSAFR
jgi:hypothetical protein